MIAKGWVVALLLSWVIGIAFPQAGWAANATVESVTVKVTTAEATPSRVMKRMTASVAAVGEQMLVGRQVADVETGSAAYERLIREIFDRVLVGYSVEDVRINPGLATQIHVKVAPWGDVVHEVMVETSLGALAPDVAELIRNDVNRVEEQIRQSLLGLPIDAVDWAGGVAKGIIREILIGQLPEFHPTIDISAGARTQVKISLSPAGPLIHEVNVTLRSRSFPNLLMHPLRPILAEMAGGIRGLPLAFVERNRDFFAARLETAARASSLTRRYSLRYTTEIRTGATTEVVIQTETDSLNISLEGWLDVGRSQDNTTVKVHAGQYISSKDELFMEVKLIPNSVTWSFEPGWSRKLTPTTLAGIRYNLSERHSKLWFNQYLGSQWLLRVERDPVDGRNEFAVRYKLHELLSVEYVFTAQEKWLRLIGNL